MVFYLFRFVFFFQAEDGIRDRNVTGVQTCALPISSPSSPSCPTTTPAAGRSRPATTRSEEHTSELQSRFDLVCRLLLEKKKKKNNIIIIHITYNTHSFIIYQNLH